MSRIFGDLIQNGYVVRDIEAAMRHWIEVLGVGPWFYIEHLAVPDFTYKGQPSPVDVSLALANSGPLQVELIQQRNDAPSLYRDFLNAGHGACSTSAMGQRISPPICNVFSTLAILLAMRGLWLGVGLLSIC